MKNEELLNSMFTSSETTPYAPRIMHRFTEIKQCLHKPDKALSKNEYERIVGMYQTLIQAVILE